MTRNALLVLVVVFMAGTSTVGVAQAQTEEAEIEVAARAISHVSDEFEQEGALVHGAMIVVDPTLINDDLVAQSTKALERAVRIGQLAGAQVGTLGNYRTCADTIPGGCRMSAAMVFRVGPVTIQGDTANVSLKYWWYAPQFREATPSVGEELTLVRSGGEWTVVDRRLRMIS